MTQIGATAVIAEQEDHDAQYARLLHTVETEFRFRTQDPKTVLFDTDAPDLFQVYLDALPMDRQIHTCNTCKKFINTYGRLVTIDDRGQQSSPFFVAGLDPESAHGFYAPAVKALQDAVAKATVTGVFYTKEPQWGQARTGVWTHMAVTPAPHLLYADRVKDDYQAMAAKRQEYEGMILALYGRKATDDLPEAKPYTRELVESALTLLKGETLFGAAKVVGVAEWLHRLIVAREGVRDKRVLNNLLWRTVSTCPIQYAFPRSGMLGTLLDDIADGLTFDVIKARFDKKMDPTVHMRPQVPPSVGNLRQAEALIQQLGVAAALHRRIAFTHEIQKVWEPRTRSAPGQALPAGSVFGHVEAKNRTPAQQAIDLKAPPKTITWQKFARDVLPTADSIEWFTPHRNTALAAFTTAQEADAPPILKWDEPDARNPFAWYTYDKGSPASQWSLVPGEWTKVTAFALKPSLWQPGFGADTGVIAVLEGCRDQNIEGEGNALFPTFLHSDLHPVRASIEGYSKTAHMGNTKGTGLACGFVMDAGQDFTDNRFRVVSGGVTVIYKLDRWD